jgi:hypothetical protein
MDMKKIPWNDGLQAANPLGPRLFFAACTDAGSEINPLFAGST